MNKGGNVATPSNVDEAEIRKRYPWLLPDELDTDQTALLLLMIEDAEQDVSAAWGEYRDRGIAALVAHRLLLQAKAAMGKTGAVWAVSKTAAGGVSADFITPPPESLTPEMSQFYTTQPGVEYMRMSRVVNSGVRLIAC